MTVVYTDGGCAGNNQRDALARMIVMVVTAANGHPLAVAEDRGGSNNIAELRAVRDALTWARDHQHTALEVRTDSRNNFAWVYGRKVGKQLNDRETVMALKAEIDTLRCAVRLKLVWVPREKNLAGHYIERRYGL